MSLVNSPELPEDRHWWFHTRTEGIRSLLDPLAGSGGLVLDVGGGAGNMAHHLSRYGRVIGTDNALKPLLVARQRGLDSTLAEAAASPFRSDSFDLIALLDIIEHCRDDDEVLAEAFRVSRPGGLVVVSTPAFSWLWSHNDVANRHLRRYSRRQLAALLRQAGFEPLRLSYGFFLVFPAAAGLVLLRKALGAKPSLTTPRDEAAYQVEMEPAPGPLNAALARVGDCEAALLRRWNLPFGTGLLAVGRKPC